MTRQYTSAAALRAAIEDRLRAHAVESGNDLNWLRRRFVFARILTRICASAPDGWILKGGMAVELRRPGLARATRDIDLVLRDGLVADPADVEQVRDLLLEALHEDVDGDRLIFAVGRGTRLRDDAYRRPAWRFTVQADLAGKTYPLMRLDVVARPEEVTGVEQLPLPDVLGFAGIPPRRVPVADPRQQYAEKLHALTRQYGTGASSRVKDLVDLVMLIEDGVVPDGHLLRTVRHVFSIRCTHQLPGQLEVPPDSWRLPFVRLADQVSLSVRTHTGAHHIVADHWDITRKSEEG